MPDDVEIEVKEKDAEGKDKDSLIGFESLIKDWEEGGKQGPKPGTERWKDIYWAAKEGERAREELNVIREELGSNKLLIEEMRKHNQALVEVLGQMNETKAESKTDEAIEKMTDKVAELREMKKAAREKSDFNAEDQIDEQLADLRFEIRKMKDAAKDEEKNKNKKKETSAIDKDNDVTDSDEFDEDDKKVVSEWIKDNKWFTRNPKLRAEAINTEKEIRKDKDFEYATMDEILGEVKKRVENKHKTSGDVDLVEGDSGSGNVDGRTKVKINPIEMELAKGFGIDTQELAKQKLIINKENESRRRKPRNA